MRSIFLALAALVCHPSFAAPSLTAPETAAAGSTISGIGGRAVQAPAGDRTVRIKGRTATKPVTVLPKETSNVAM